MEQCKHCVVRLHRITFTVALRATWSTRHDLLGKFFLLFDRVGAWRRSTSIVLQDVHHHDRLWRTAFKWLSSFQTATLPGLPERANADSSRSRQCAGNGRLSSVVVAFHYQHLHPSPYCRTAQQPVLTKSYFREPAILGRTG